MRQASYYVKLLTSLMHKSNRFQLKYRNVREHLMQWSMYSALGLHLSMRTLHLWRERLFIDLEWAYIEIKISHCECSCRDKQWIEECSHVTENRARDLTFKCKILPPSCYHCFFTEPLSFFHGVLSPQPRQVLPPSHCHRVIAST